MNEISKPNDILLATLQKPDASYLDLLKNNIVSDNTQFLSRDEYKSTPLIQQKFTKDGIFDEEAFNKLYDLAEAKFTNLDENQNLDNLLKEVEYSQTSFFRPLDAKVTDSSYRYEVIKDNPLQQAIGLEGVNYKSAATKSAKEVAQSHKIWDPVNRKWLDETAEDRSLLSKTFGQSLVYAKYTKDGEQANPITGKMGYHQKGEYITDQDGQYFTQLSQSEDLINGAEIVKLQDILTKEDSAINNIDFFDSDGLDKNIFGVAAKTLTSIGLYMVPYVGEAYTAANVLIGLGKNMPVLYKSFGSLLGFNTPQVSPTANKLINYFSKFDSSMSDYGATHFWSVESLGNQIADTVGQLYEQRAMAKLSTFVMPFKDTKIDNMQQYQQLVKEAQRRGELAKSLSLGYMAIDQAAQTYNDALEGGYNEKTAGVATLLTTAALFGIMRFNEGVNGVGTWFLDKTTGYDKDLMRAPIDRAAKKTTREIASILESAVEDPTKGQKVKNKLLKYASKVDDYVRLGGEGMWKGFINEGVEEVSEEVIQDGIKGLIDGITYLGYKQGYIDKQGSFGGWENVFSRQGLERYLQTFIGGAIGGALFDFHQTKVEPFFNSFNSTAPKPVQKADLDMLDIALQGRTEEFLKALDPASKFISDRKTYIKDSEGRYMIAEQGQQSIRDIVVQEARNRMKTMDALAKRILQEGQISKLPQGDFRDQIIKHYKPIFEDAKVMDFIERRFQKNVEKVVNDIKKGNTIQSQLDSSDITVDQKNALNEQLKSNKSLIEEDLKYVREFFSGKAHVDTLTQAQFLLNPRLRELLTVGLTEEEFYENVLKEDSELSYSKLETKGLNKMTKEKVHQLYQLFKYSENNLDTLVESLPLLQKTMDKLSDLISPDLEEFIKNTAHQSVIRETIGKMRQDFEARKEQIDNYNYVAMLQEQMGESYNDLTDEQKKTALAELREKTLQDLIREFNVDHLLDMIRENPKAFSNSERYAIDYAQQLFDAGIISVNEHDYTDEQIKILKDLINTEFINTPLTIFSLNALKQIISNVNVKLGDESNSFRKAIVEKKTAADDSLIDVSLSLIDFHEDHYDPTIQFFKIKSLEDYVGDGMIFEDVYNYILSAKKQTKDLRVSLFKQELEKLLGDINGASAKDATLEDIQNALILAFSDQSKQTALTELAKKYLGIENLNIFMDSAKYKNAIESDYENFEKKYKDKIVKNPFKNALTKIYFSLGGTNGNVIDYIANKTLEIIEGNADASSIVVTDQIHEEMSHISETLQTVLTVAAIMAPIKDFDGQSSLDSINQLRKDFARAMGQDDKNIHTITSEQYDLLSTVISEVSNQLVTLDLIYGNLVEDQNKEFEQTRKKMIANSYRLFKYHANTDELDGLFKIEGTFGEETDNIEEQEKQILIYKQKLYEKINNLLKDEDWVEKNIGNVLAGETPAQALVRKFVEIYNKSGEPDNNLSIFYYNESDLQENDIQDDNINTYTQYWLNELVSLVAAEPKKVAKAINDSLREAGQNFYPRQDQIKALEQIIPGVLNPDIYYAYITSLEELYNSHPEGAAKTAVQNLIRVPGPAGSGKTTLYKILISSLSKLGIKPEQIASTAKTKLKVQNLRDDLKETLKEENILTLDKIINKLDYYSKQYEETAEDLLTRIVELKDTLSNEDSYMESYKGGDFKVEVDKTSGIITCSLERDGMVVYLTLDPKKIKGSKPFAEVDLGILTVDFTDTSILDEIVPIKKDTKVLLLDECTNLNPLEWNLLNRAASKNDIVIIATGDTKQRGYKSTKREKDAQGKDHIVKSVLGDDNILGFNIPELSSVHRGHNSAVKHNELTLRSIITKINEKKDSHSGLSSDVVNKDLQTEIGKSLENVVLQYTTDHSELGFLGALSTKDDSIFKNTLNKIDKQSSILGIVESEEQILELKKILEDLGFTNINVTTSDQIQGAEADYAIAYKLKSQLSKHQNLQELYTVTTRGRRGIVGYQSNLMDIVKYQEVNNVHIITRNRTASDAGALWIDAVDKIISEIPEEETAKEETPEKEPEEPKGKTMPKPKDSSNIEDDSAAETPEDKIGEEENKSSIDTFKKIIGNGDPTAEESSNFLMIHQLGYIPGIEKAEIEKIRSWNATDISKLPESPFKHVLEWVNNSFKKENFNNFYSSAELNILQNIHSNARKLSPQQAYIYVVNSLSHCLMTKNLDKFTIQRYGQINYWLKPNDDTTKTPTKSIILSMPLQMDEFGNISKFVILGTVGYTDESKAKSFMDALPKEGVKIYQMSNIDHKKGLKSVFGSKNNWNYNSKSALLPVTGIRYDSINPELNDSEKVGGEELRKNARWSLDAWFKMGWEQSGELLDTSKMSEEDIVDLYNASRIYPMKKENAENIAQMAGKSGSIIIMHPIGRPDLKQPIILRHAVTWNDFFKDALKTTTSGKSKHLYTYKSRMILVALSKVLTKGTEFEISFEDLDNDHIKKFEKTSSVNPKNLTIGSEIKETSEAYEFDFTDKTLQKLSNLLKAVDTSSISDKDKEDFKRIIKGCRLQILSSAIDRNVELEEMVQNLRGGNGIINNPKTCLRFFPFDFNAIQNFLTENLPSWAYTSGKIELENKPFIEKTYERPNLILDLNNIQEFQITGGETETSSTTITVDVDKKTIEANNSFKENELDQIKETIISYYSAVINEPSDMSQQDFINLHSQELANFVNLKYEKKIPSIRIISTNEKNNDICNKMILFANEYYISAFEGEGTLFEENYINKC